MDIKIRFHPVAGTEGGPDAESGFHLLAVPLYDSAQRDQTYSGLLIKVLDAMWEDGGQS